MKFPLLLHFILVTTTIGLAAGTYDAHLSVLVVYPLIGLAAGLGMSFLWRFMIS